MAFGRSKQVSLSPQCPLHLQVPDNTQEGLSLLPCVMHTPHPGTHTLLHNLHGSLMTGICM